jgi:hypothetical protein
VVDFQNFRTSPEKDFCNNIGTETCRWAVTMSVLRGRAEVVGTRPTRRD